MSNLEHELKIRFGLSREPAIDEIKNWVRYSNDYINDGLSTEKAALRAAERAFNGVGEVGYRSHSATITALLEAARNK